MKPEEPVDIGWLIARIALIFLVLFAFDVLGRIIGSDTPRFFPFGNEKGAHTAPECDDPVDDYRFSCS